MDKDDVMKISANFDKETKTTYRYLINDNEYGISGTIYVKQEKVKNPHRLLLKAKFKDKKKD